jgi:RNA polymerase sigma-70 factor (ECF subfamily)
MWRQESRGALREDIRGYLFTTAMNVVRDFWRRDRARHTNDHIELSDSLESVRSIGAEKTLAEREAVRMIEVQLGKLRPSTRAVFLLHHVEHLTCEEIAARLKISVRTVERELARALDSCRSALGGIMADLLE